MVLLVKVKSNKTEGGFICRLSQRQASLATDLMNVILMFQPSTDAVTSFSL